ncbi:hypothetical protein TNCV_3733041 [Trichonephila clavipes]|nr:hypothetical protein TNCV_3733041 [Trichonephila clavipes]
MVIHRVWINPRGLRITTPLNTSGMILEEPFPASPPPLQESKVPLLKCPRDLPKHVNGQSVRRESDLRKPCCDSIQIRRRRASCSKKIKLIYSVYGQRECPRRKRSSEAVLRLNSSLKLCHE